MTAADLAARRAPGFRLSGPTLDEGQREVLAAALADAIEYREERGSGDYCATCEASVSGICDDHAADVDLAVAYQQLAAELGIEVGP